MSYLNVIYDLKNEPIHFGILPTLVLADIYRELAGIQLCRLWIVKAPGDGFRRHSIRDQGSDVEEKHWRLDHLIKAAGRLLPSCKSVSVMDSRSIFETMLPLLSPPTFPSNYSLERGIMIGKHKSAIAAAKDGLNIQRLKAAPYPVNAAQKWVSSYSGGQPAISLTLRQSEFKEGRNSRVDQWVNFADYLVSKGYTPIFVPDTEASLNGRLGLPERFLINELAAIDLEVRNAFYEVCDLNFFVGNGPCFLPFFNKHIDYVVCNLLIPGYYTESPEHYDDIGLPVGSQMPGRQNKYGELVWERDDSEVLIRAFTDWQTRNIRI